MDRKLLSLAVLLSGLMQPLAAKTYFLSGCILNMPSAKVWLAEVYGGRLRLLDSTATDAGCFDFRLPDTLQPGMYSVILNPQRTAFVDVLLDRAPVHFNADYRNLLGTIDFTTSADNTLLYSYLKGDSAYRNSLLKELRTQELTGIAAVLLKAQQPFKYPAGTTDTGAWFQEHFWDRADFGNNVLIRSDVLPAMLTEFLEHYQREGIDHDEQVVRWAEAVDALMLRTAPYPAVHRFFIAFLGGKFEYGNYDLLGAYIREYYGGRDLCENGISAQENAAARLGRLQYVSVGKTAPDIAMPAHDGSVLRLSNMQSRHIIVTFWSSNCSHCIETLPKMEWVYNHRRDSSLEVLAISLDTRQEDWQAFLKSGNYGWVNYSDLQGWNSPIAKRYNVQGTPTYLLLDERKTIVAKPATFEELVQELRSRGLY